MSAHDPQHTPEGEHPVKKTGSEGHSDRDLPGKGAPSGNDDPSGDGDPSGNGGRSGNGDLGGSAWGILAEFQTVEDLLHAAEQVRDAGFRHWDAHTPYPVHGLNDAMGVRMTRLPLLVLGGGLAGAALSLLMQWWMNAIDYKYMISGKPFFSVPANIPVMFELTVLFASAGAFLGMLAFNRLPEHHHPLFRSERFRRATQDRFFISIEARDPRFDPERVPRMLARLGSTHVERVEED